MEQIEKIKLLTHSPVVGLDGVFEEGNLDDQGKQSQRGTLS
jgi:hypothetical protein